MGRQKLVPEHKRFNVYALRAKYAGDLSCVSYKASKCTIDKWNSFTSCFFLE